MRLPSHRFGHIAVFALGCTQSLAAHAHGIEMATPFVIWPALVVGLIGGAYAGSRRISRLAGLTNVLGIFLASLAVVALVLALSEIPESGAIVLLQALVLAVIVGLLLGVIPLVIGYVVGEYTALRFVRKREASADQKNGA
jgi:hypothetical protein